MKVSALVGDLMDRSRISTAIPDAHFVGTAAACNGSTVVVVDLARFADAVESVVQVAPNAKIVCFVSHVDTATADRARAAGAHVVLPRSRFFRDVHQAVHGT